MSTTKQSRHPLPDPLTEFQVYNKDGSLKRGIVKAFLVKMVLDCGDFAYQQDKGQSHPTVTINGEELPISLHPEILEQFKTKETVNALLSVQFRANGQHCVVAHVDKSKQWGENRA